MYYGFWEQLAKPMFVLAPMADVTDSVFRQIIVKYGRPDMVFTEFVPCDGLCSKGRDNLLPDLQFVEDERPIVAQIFGAKPENFYETGKLIAQLGFDGVDINMGCPEKSVVKQGAGSGLIRTPSLAQEVIRATQEGTAAGGKRLPVSVKTRLGFSSDEFKSWVPALLSMKLPVLTIHARTRKEMSKVPARWEQVKEIVELAKGTGTYIIGNGDVTDLTDAQRRVEETQVDGVMLGRAIFGNPWLFRRDGYIPSLSEVLSVLVEHTNLYESTWGDTKPFDLMKKHYKAYISGFPGAHELRIQLMGCKNAHGVTQVVEAFLARSQQALNIERAE